MGCAASSIVGGERLQASRERKRLMKQLLGFRGDFADSLLAYLRALKNTGVALRQFTESESMELEDVDFDLGYPPSPPPPLPPSPPPPPPLNSDPRKFEGSLNTEATKEEIIEIDEDSDGTPPPPPIPSSSWDNWDPFDSTSPSRKHNHVVELVDEEKWAETGTEFEEAEEEEGVPDKTTSVLPIVMQDEDAIDENTSTSSLTKEKVDRAMVFLRSKKTLPSIIKELDDHFLKASAASREIAVLVDINTRDCSLHHDSRESKRKGSSSAKVFSSLSWSWSSRSLLSMRNATDIGSLDEPCRPGAHSITLAKLYAEEQRLYKALKEEELTKSELERKSLMLLKQEDENADWTKTERTRAIVENLESDMARLQDSICRSSSSILALLEEEVHPQLVALLSGLRHMWRTMHESHEAQIHISQQLNLLSGHHNTVMTSEHHREAAVQLESEVKHWYNSFCRLANTQREYVRALHMWIQLTNCLLDNTQQNNGLSVVRTVSEEWQLACNQQSEKVASEAIKRFLSLIHSIISQHEEELNLKKKCDKLERRLQKELDAFREAEIKLGFELGVEASCSSLSPKHPLSLRHAKAKLLRKQYEDEKAKYLNSVQDSRAMTLSSLQRCLPDVFQTVTAYSGACSQALEAVLFLPHEQA